jgi:hypothetical protein
MMYTRKKSPKNYSYNKKNTKNLQKFYKSLEGYGPETHSEQQHSSFSYEEGTTQEPSLGTRDYNTAAETTQLVRIYNSKNNRQR